VSNASRYLPTNIIGNKILRGDAIPDAIGKIDTFSSTIDIKARDQRTNLANIERGLGNQAYVNQNTVNISVGAGTDPAVVGRVVQRNLDALDRRGR